MKNKQDWGRHAERVVLKLQNSKSIGKKKKKIVTSKLTDFHGQVPIPSILMLPILQAQLIIGGHSQTVSSKIRRWKDDRLENGTLMKPQLL